MSPRELVGLCRSFYPRWDDAYVAAMFERGGVARDMPFGRAERVGAGAVHKTGDAPHGTAHLPQHEKQEGHQAECRDGDGQPENLRHAFQPLAAEGDLLVEVGMGDGDEAVELGAQVLRGEAQLGHPGFLHFAPLQRFRQQGKRRGHDAAETAGDVLVVGKQGVVVRRVAGQLAHRRRQRFVYGEEIGRGRPRLVEQVFAAFDAGLEGKALRIADGFTQLLGEVQHVQARMDAAPEQRLLCLDTLQADAGADQHKQREADKGQPKLGLEGMFHRAGSGRMTWRSAMARPAGLARNSTKRRASARGAPRVTSSSGQHNGYLPAMQD